MLQKAILTRAPKEKEVPTDAFSPSDDVTDVVRILVHHRGREYCNGEVEAEARRELTVVNSIGASIDKAWFTFLCPLCGLENDWRVQQAALEERVHCRGCHETIHFVDRDASTMTTKRQIDSALNKLQKALRKFR